MVEADIMSDGGICSTREPGQPWLERLEEEEGGETITSLLETIRWEQCSGKEGRSFSCRDRNSVPLRFLAYDASRFKRVSTTFPSFYGEKWRNAGRDSDFRCRGCSQSVAAIPPWRNDNRIE